MSRVDELIAELAPEGVAIKTLGDVGQFVRGNGLQKSDLTDEGAPAIHYGQVHTHYGVWADRTKSFTDPEYAARLRRAKPGDLVIATTSEDDAAVAKATAWLGESEAAVSGDAYVYRHELDPKYVAYFFSSTIFQDQKARHITGTKVRRVSGDALAKIRIPVPPIEVQREIAGILDKFTLLESELQTELHAELQARARQYERYKSALLVAAGKGEAVAIGDYIDYVRGLTYSKADEVDSVSDGFPVLRSNNISLGSNRLNFDDVRLVGRTVRTRPDQWLKRDDILLSAGSGSKTHVGKAALITKDMEYTFGGFMAVVRAHDEFSPRYLYHHLTSARFRDYLDATIASTTINNLTRSIVGAFEVPPTDRADQERIAALLDAFAALTNDLAIGLSAELRARRTQYEYYRDKLFGFEEAAA